MNHHIILPPTNLANNLTKREWFAGMALQGLLANPAYTPPDPNCDAGVAFREADAMLLAGLKTEAPSAREGGV